MIQNAYVKSKGVGASKFGAQKKVEKTQKKPQLEEYISNRDYTGAIALMEFQRASNPGEEVEKFCHG